MQFDRRDVRRYVVRFASRLIDRFAEHGSDPVTDFAERAHAGDAPSGRRTGLLRPRVVGAAAHGGRLGPVKPDPRAPVHGNLSYLAFSSGTRECPGRASAAPSPTPASTP
ncbi:hypothetical protein [Streptomyces sp. NPDC059176]|uniref:hypothetical protein n=1 Tax=unclassified Streptomyces TaxID=2593676 RepID=UPI0036A6EA77